MAVKNARGQIVYDSWKDGSDVYKDKKGYYVALVLVALRPQATRRMKTRSNHPLLNFNVHAPTKHPFSVLFGLIAQSSKQLVE